MEKMLPCPFCGHEPELEESYFIFEDLKRCEKCQTVMYPYVSERNNYCVNECTRFSDEEKWAETDICEGKCGMNKFPRRLELNEACVACGLYQGYFAICTNERCLPSGIHENDHEWTTGYPGIELAIKAWNTRA